MNIYITDKRPKNSKSFPLTNLEGWRPEPKTPELSCFKDIFSFDDGGPSGRAVGSISCLKNVMADYISVREKINPNFARRLNHVPH